MRTLIIWFREAFTQDDFAGDWYGWLTNQISHLLLGVVAALVVSMGCFVIVGEYPVKVLAWGIITVVYVALEILRGWSGRDSIEDTAFFGGYGAGGTFLVFSEVTPGSPYLLTDARDVLLVLFFVALHLVGGIVFRARR